MKNIVFLSICISLSLWSKSQDSPSDFLKKQCVFTTDGTGASAGIKMKISYPCAWDKGDSPPLIKLFSYNIPDSVMLSCGIIIARSTSTITATDKQNIFNKDWAQLNLKGFGELQTIKSIIIDHHPWAEYYFVAKFNTPQDIIYQHALVYYCIYGNTGIMISYKAAAFEEALGKSFFEKYEPMFKTLAVSISVMN